MKGLDTIWVMEHEGPIRGIWETRAETAKLDSAARETYTLFKIRIVQNKPLLDSWALGAAETSGRAS